MNVRCPACNTQYQIDDQKIPPQGASIRCPSCRHVFTTSPQQAVPLPGEQQTTDKTQRTTNEPIALPAAPQPSAGELDWLQEFERASQDLQTEANMGATPLPASEDTAWLDELGKDNAVELPPSSEPATPLPGSDAHPLLDSQASADTRTPVGTESWFQPNSADLVPAQTTESPAQPTSPPTQTASPPAPQKPAGGGETFDPLDEFFEPTSGGFGESLDLPGLKEVTTRAARSTLGSGLDIDLPGPVEKNTRSDLPGLTAADMQSPHSGRWSADLPGLRQESTKPTGSTAPDDDPLSAVFQEILEAGRSETKQASADLAGISVQGLEDDTAIPSGPKITRSKQSQVGARPTQTAPETQPAPQKTPRHFRLPKKIVVSLAVGLLVLSVGAATKWLTPWGLFGIGALVDFLEPPAPSVPQLPPVQQPKRASPEQILAWSREASFTAYQKAIGELTQPEQSLQRAKLSAFAALQYGAQHFPVPEIANLPDNTDALKLQIARQLLVQNSTAAIALAQTNAAPPDLEFNWLLGRAQLILGEQALGLEHLDTALTRTSSFAPALHEIGEHFLRLNNLNEAATWFEKAYKKNPAYARSAWSAAQAYGKAALLGQQRRALWSLAPYIKTGLPPEQHAEAYYAAAQAKAENAPTEALALAHAARQADPNNLAAQLLAIRLECQTGQSKQALANIDSIAKKQPKAFDVVEHRARCLFLAKDPASALGLLSPLTETASPAAVLLKAQIHKDLGQWQDGRDLVKKLLSQQTDNPALYVCLAEIELGDGKIDPAFEAAQKAKELAPESPEAWSLLGEIHLRREQATEAAIAFQKAMRIDDSQRAARLGLGRAYLLRAAAADEKREQALTLALPLLTQLASEYADNLDVLFTYGKALELDQRPDEAVEIYQKAVSLTPKETQAHLRIVAAHLDRTPPAVDKAKAAFSAAQRIETELNRPRSPEVAYWQARIELSEGRSHEAEVNMRNAVEGEPNNANYLLWLGRILETNNSLYEAMDAYKKALALNSHLVEVYRTLGRSAMELNRYAEARRYFDAYRERQPDKPEIWFDIGQSYARQNQLTKALKSFERVLKLRPKHAPSLLATGNALSQSGKEKKAVGFYERALRADPTLDEAACYYGISLSRTKVVAKGKKALQQCTAAKNAPEDLRAIAREILESNG